jgi:hypothetical protein
MFGTPELTMAMVLCTGWDQALLDTRSLILQSAGHEVRQAKTQKELVSACDQPHLGKSLEDADSWLAVPADIPSQLAEEVARLANIAAS